MYEFTQNGRAYVAECFADSDMGAPWEECDGHGIVSEWTKREKAPGEFILSDDGRKKRFYDFAESVKIARRDGWGYAPGKLTVERFKRSGRAKYRARFAGVDIDGYGPDQNAAILALYKAHRATMTAREYAARAAMADFEYLRKWCAGDWQYVVVGVRPFGAPDTPDSWNYLGGVESECWIDTAHEIAGEM